MLGSDARMEMTHYFRELRRDTRGKVCVLPGFSLSLSLSLSVKKKGPNKKINFPPNIKCTSISSPLPPPHKFHQRRRIARRPTAVQDNHNQTYWDSWTFISCLFTARTWTDRLVRDGGWGVGGGWRAHLLIQSSELHGCVCVCVCVCVCARA